MKSLILVLALSIFLVGSDRKPMTADFKDSASYRWLNKKVLESRVLDDMEDLTHWKAYTKGSSGLVDARKVAKVEEVKSMVAEISLSSDKKLKGDQSLQLDMPTKLQGPGPKSGRGWGTAGVRRSFENEDWSNFNRISVWIHPDCQNFYTVALGLQLYNEGEEKIPALFGQEGETSIILRNHEWNHIVWEIGNVARDKVSGFEVSYYFSGNEPEISDHVTFYFDQLELEKVEPDHIEGWNVWPGKISYCHSGYQPGASKSAIASNLNAHEFRLIDQETGQGVLTKPIKTVNSQLGTFQVMDFSEIRKTGSYIIEAGEVRTQPFRIDPNVWRESILKALNYFYVERCGAVIPGVHGVCHRDWTVVHGDKRIVINGGWHDAGDLTQGIDNTSEIAYGMFSLAERLHARGEDPELYERLVDEAKYGLDWILKTSFRDGYRNSGSVNSRRTNGIIGDDDDVTVTAKKDPMKSFVAASTEAIAYRVLKERDPRLASYSLEMAEEDWQFAIEAMDEAKDQASPSLWRVTFDSDNVGHHNASTGIMASMDLWKSTGKQRYADKAVELAEIVLESQERNKPDWDVPLTGFFYTGPDKKRILHYCHKGREQAPILALTMLCEAFPEHPDWMRWYSAVTLHSEYLKTISKYTEPYDVFPASIYNDKEYVDVPESRRESFRQQVLNGIPLGSGRYLRLFPVWMDYRGHFGTILPQAQALINAAYLRGDFEAAQISHKQMQWVIGRNPFSQSTMWGEGYDFPPLYTPSSGDIVGALPVGIQTRGNSDAPYWPIQNTWTYKEIWGHPVAMWVWLMKDLHGPALVEGQAAKNVEFEDIVSGQQFQVTTNTKTGRFREMLPEGKYIIRCDGQEKSATFLPGASYNMDMRPGMVLDLDISQITSSDGKVTIKVSARGMGSHNLNIRTDNLTLVGSQKKLTLKPGSNGILEFKGRIISLNSPWVAVIVPNDDISQRKEIRGALWEK